MFRKIKTDKKQIGSNAANSIVLNKDGEIFTDGNCSCGWLGSSPISQRDDDRD